MCVKTEAECAGLYVSREKRICVRRADDCYIYLNEYSYESDTEKLCVTKETCINSNRIVTPGAGSPYVIYPCVLPDTCNYAYAALGICWYMFPDMTEDFDPTKK